MHRLKHPVDTRHTTGAQIEKTHRHQFIAEMAAQLQAATGNDARTRAQETDQFIRNILGEARFVPVKHRASFPAQPSRSAGNAHIRVLSKNAALAFAEAETR